MFVVKNNFSTLARSLPKAEVHVHLEGCINVALLTRWADEANIRLPRPSHQLLDFAGLSDFLEFLNWSCALADTPDRLSELAYAFCRRITASGARYGDVIVNPTHWATWKDRLPAFIEAINDGLTAAETDGLASVGICVSLLRSQTAAEATELVEGLCDLKSKRVVALSVDGDEALVGRTGLRFSEAFRRAGELGLRRTVHAGESSGPEGVRDAIELLGADRIDHGVRAIENDDVVSLLVDRQIPLGICPTSNIMLGLYPTIGDHPLDRLRQAGVPISINSDDPALLHTTLEDEYAQCIETFEWNMSVLSEVAKASVHASFATADLKQAIIRDIDLWLSDDPEFAPNSASDVRP